MTSISRRVVLTSDHHAWLLGGFFYQWLKYDNRPIEVLGFTPPPSHLLSGHPFVSIGPFKDYPLERWSDALIEYLEDLTEELVEIWLEDYWLIRPSNLDLLLDAEDYMHRHPDVVRFDLSTDRLYAPGVRDVEWIGSMDLVEAPGAPYSFSMQASIWNRYALLGLLRHGENPWQAELMGTMRLNQSGLRVVGTRQGPVRYIIAVNKGKLDRTGAWMFPPRTLNQNDWSELDRLGLTGREEAEGGKAHVTSPGVS